MTSGQASKHRNTMLCGSLPLPFPPTSPFRAVSICSPQHGRDLLQAHASAWSGFSYTPPSLLPSLPYRDQSSGMVRVHPTPG